MTISSGFKKICLAIVIASVNVCFTFTQENVKIKKSQFFTVETKFKEAWKAVKSGVKYYKKGIAEYRRAREQYLKAYTYNDKNAALNYKIGVCYLYTDDKPEAIKYLQKAFQIDNNLVWDIHFQLARAYHMNYDFDNAIKEYKLFLASTPKRKLKTITVNIDRCMQECENGKDLITKPVRVVVQNLGKNINSEYDDYASVFDSKEETMYFTTRRLTRKNNKLNAADNKYGENIYISKRRGRDWSLAQPFDQFNTRKSEGMLAVSPDNKKLYFYQSKKNGTIGYSEQEDLEWSRIKAVPKINSRKGRETSVAFTPDGKMMFFVSDKDYKGSIGGKDIYYCVRDSKGDYSKPVNMGATVNTPYNEDAVWVSHDGKTLYFSSKGHESMGGYDIFSTSLVNIPDWSKPENIGYPINTPDDDLYFSMSSNGKFGYLSANREKSNGGRDIYRVIYIGAEKEFDMPAGESPAGYAIYPTPGLLDRLPQYFTVDTSVVIMGKVYDADSKKGIMSKIQFIDSQKSQVVAVVISDSIGNYSAKLPEKKSFGVEINAKGYLFYLDMVNLKDSVKDVVRKDFALKELSIGAKVVLKNIFFETGKATLKEESFQQLEAVIAFMKENPSLKLEISGHTDNVGAMAANIKLSQARAKAVVTYMVTNGIEQERLTFEGYGPKQPIAPNNTKEGKAKNRRVEFKITGK